MSIVRIRCLGIPGAAAIMLVVAIAGTTQAHVLKDFGPYRVALGWSVEPTYVGQVNAIQVVVKDKAGKAVTDLADGDLKVAVSIGGQQSSALSLINKFDPDTGLGVPDDYEAPITPTTSGDYTFHLTGSIHGQAVDETATSSDKTFNSAIEATDIQPAGSTAWRPRGGSKTGAVSGRPRDRPGRGERPAQSADVRPGRLRVAALIGSTMAECDPDFAGDLGPDAVGIFASDRPTGGFQPSALDPAARAVYERFAGAWAPRDSGSGKTGGYGSADPAPSAPEYTISGPVETGSAAAGPSEEGLSGFAAAWALFHDVLPAAARSGSLDASAVATAARSIDLPTGSLPNGAGLRFSSDPATLCQNQRAAAVIWQWQAVRSYTFVWPPTYQTGGIGFVALAR